MVDEAEAVRILALRLGARLLGECPGCGGDTVYSSTGHVTYCHRCTIRELGTDPQHEAQRRGLGMSRDNYARWRAETISRAGRSRLLDPARWDPV